MKNGHDTTQQVQINPQIAASYALQFLEQVAHTRAQRDQYDIATGLLQAIATGQVVLAPPPPPAMGLAPEPKADER